MEPTPYSTAPTKFSSSSVSLIIFFLISFFALRALTFVCNLILCIYLQPCLVLVAERAPFQEPQEQGCSPAGAQAPAREASAVVAAELRPRVGTQAPGPHGGWVFPHQGPNMCILRLTEGILQNTQTASLLTISQGI